MECVLRVWYPADEPRGGCSTLRHRWPAQTGVEGKRRKGVDLRRVKRGH